MNKTVFLAWVAAAAFAVLRVAGAEQIDVGAAAESDQRLHSDGKGWKLDRARILDPDRPRILLIGDSILNGYQQFVITKLEGRAYVDAWRHPHAQSERLNQLLAEMLAFGPYDVVHFNMGLHGWQKGRIKEGAYQPLTRAFIEVIRQRMPRARIIWANTTPVTAKGRPTELDPEINPVIIEHNRLASEVMEELGVPSNDFYSLLVNRLALARGDQFHWTAPAYVMLAEIVSLSLERELGLRAAGR